MTEHDELRRAVARATAAHYDIIEELGRGGMATVYLARERTRDGGPDRGLDRGLDRRVAIKVLAPALLAVEGMAERFVQEARIAAALVHPNIIPIHSMGRNGDVLYFVMRYVAGRPLDAILGEQGPLPLDVVRAILTEVGKALDAAHRQGIVHRDIKPANILVDADGSVVVADFGIARIADRPGVTQSGQTVGTPAYMSPEQCAGQTLDGASDQYALGVVAYELLTGAPPFVGENLMQVVWRMVHEELVPVPTRRPDCDAALADAVLRMLARDVASRFPSVGAALAAVGPLEPVAGSPVRQALARLARSASVATPRASSAPTAVVPRVASLRLAHPTAILTVDDVVNLSCEALDAGGETMSLGADVAWESGDPSVVRVDPEGRATAIGLGRAAVTAQVGDARATMTLVVSRAGLRALSLAPRPATLEVGDRVTLELVAQEAGGTLPHPRLAAWRSSDPAVVNVDARGALTACGEGTATIRARAGGVEGSHTLRVTRAVIAAVRVTAPAARLGVGDRLRLAAAPANTNGHPLRGLPVRWEVSDPAIAAVSEDGVVTALRSGQVLIAARVGGRVGTARLTVAASR